MLPDWMIEKLEQDRRERDEQVRPRLELEIDVPTDDRRVPPASDDVGGEAERGVVTIQIF